MKIQNYLNFDGQTEEAFKFYQSILGGELTLNRMSDAPEICEQIADHEKNRIMHAALSFPNGDMLMSSDILPSAGHTLETGNNFHISLHPTNKQEAKRIFDALSENGKIEMPIQDAFWGSYFGSFKDKYGINWMINCEETL